MYNRSRDINRDTQCEIREGDEKDFKGVVLDCQQCFHTDKLSGFSVGLPSQN